jgi:hypothetical protein
MTGDYAPRSAVPASDVSGAFIRKGFTSTLSIVLTTSEMTGIVAASFRKKSNVPGHPIPLLIRRELWV